MAEHLLKSGKHTPEETAGWGNPFFPREVSLLNGPEGGNRLHWALEKMPSSYNKLTGEPLQASLHIWRIPVDRLENEAAVLRITMPEGWRPREQHEKPF